MPLLVAPHTDLLMPDLLIEGMQKAIPRRARAVRPLADADRTEKLSALDQAGAALLNGDGVLSHGRRQRRGRELEPGHTGGLPRGAGRGTTGVPVAPPRARGCWRGWCAAAWQPRPGNSTPQRLRVTRPGRADLAGG